jgi:hypothetical protein
MEDLDFLSMMTLMVGYVIAVIHLMLQLIQKNMVNGTLITQPMIEKAGICEVYTVTGTVTDRQ